MGNDVGIDDVGVVGITGNEYMPFIVSPLAKAPAGKPAEKDDHAIEPGGDVAKNEGYIPYDVGDIITVPLPAWVGFITGHEL